MMVPVFRRLRARWRAHLRIRRARTPDDVLPHYRGFGRMGRWD